MKTVFHLFAFFLLSLSLLAQQPPGYADQILGRWDVTVQGADGVSYPSWFELQHRTETSLMANFVGRFGSRRHASQVEYKDSQLTIRIPRQYEVAPEVLTFVGKLSGDKLVGTVQDEKGNPLNWTAVRAPELRRATNPAWGKAIKLFNGRDLTGWKLRSPERGNCWAVENSVLTNKTPCVDLISEQKFSDFKLHVEFQIIPRGNSGVYLRGRYEAQIQDDLGKALDTLRMGGIYGFLKPATAALKKAGEWQTYDITLIGRRVTVVLNGQTIIANEEIPGLTGGALDSHEGEPGPLMLQGDHTKVLFRDITITTTR
jgi:hypothetical protein